MKHFYLITNRTKDPELIYSGKIQDYLTRQGAVCVMAEERSRKDVSGLYTSDADIPAETECILVLGGDGTLLQAVRDTLSKDIPLIGINLGTLGYLAEIDINRFESAMDQLLADQYTMENRMMLEASVIKKNSGGFKKDSYVNYDENYVNQQDKMAITDYALNDVVLTRSGSLQTIHYEIYVNQLLLASYLADGVIVATPTGSTGYNMSAGGPIVKPGARTLLLTPICPHTLNTRSIVLSPEDEIRIVVAEGKDGMKQNVEANFDGHGAILLQSGDEVIIRSAERSARIVKLSQESFLRTLQHKMK